MTRNEYDGICRAVYGGEKRKVENRSLHEQGEVFNCDSNTFNVHVGGEVRQWSRLVCEETNKKD